MPPPRTRTFIVRPGRAGGTGRPGRRAPPRGPLPVAVARDDAGGLAGSAPPPRHLVEGPASHGAHVLGDRLAADYTQGEWLSDAPKVRPAAYRPSANGSSSGTRSPMRRRATSFPTPVILKPWLESAIM